MLQELATLLKEHAERAAACEAELASARGEIDRERDEAMQAAEAQHVRTHRSVDAEL